MTQDIQICTYPAHCLHTDPTVCQRPGIAKEVAMCQKATSACLDALDKEHTSAQMRWRAKVPDAYASYILRQYSFTLGGIAGVVSPTPSMKCSAQSKEIASLNQRQAFVVARHTVAIAPRRGW